MSPAGRQAGREACRIQEWKNACTRDHHGPLTGPEGSMDGSGRAFPLKSACVFVLLVVVSCVSVSVASEITLSVPSDEYYVLAGEEAIIPLTVASTYGHDVTGDLNVVMIPKGGMAAAPGDATVRTQTFSAFTESRTVSLPVGRSDQPSDYRVTIAFRYPEGSGRISTLEGLIVHVVTTLDDPGANTGNRDLVSTDSVDASATPPSGSTPAEGPGTSGPDAALQSGQMSQDSSALKAQMMQETNQSRVEGDLLTGYLMSDSLILALNRSMTLAGFTLQAVDVLPLGQNSGSFMLAYRSATGDAGVRGHLEDTRVLYAELSSKNPVPLPDALRENATYQAYGSRIERTGFSLDQRVVNLTTERTTVDLTYTGTAGQALHLHADIVNGTVTRIEGDDPDDLVSRISPYLAFLSVGLLSAGIWYLARHRREDENTFRPPAGVPESRETYRETAARLLDDAEQEAARAAYPEAFRKTGRALRIVLSHEIGSGKELTAGDLEPFLASSTERDEKIRTILDRTREVGFAKDTPGEGEFGEMIHYTRMLLDANPTGETQGSSGEHDMTIQRSTAQEQRSRR